MTSAFDTIRRQTILDLLIDAGCNEDEVHLVRFLLSNIKIKVKVNTELSLEYESSIGGPQGDSLSGKLFTLVLAGALYHLRAVTALDLNLKLSVTECLKRVNTATMLISWIPIKITLKPSLLQQEKSLVRGIFKSTRQELLFILG